VIALGIAAGVVLVLWLGYIRTPILSKPWRVVVRASRVNNTVRVSLVRRFNRPNGLSPENWIVVGSVNPDDPDFDEKLIALQFKAHEIRRRIEMVA
jgi:hypothetical protein